MSPNVPQDELIFEIHAAVLRIEGQMNEHQRRIEAHDHMLNGNGTPGVKIDVDRLKEIQKSNSKHLFIVYGAIIAMILEIIGSYIKQL